MSSVLVFSHDHGGPALPFLLTDHQLIGGQGGLIVVDVLDHEDDGSRAALGG